MTKTIQHLRGTTAQNDAFTGAAGEITVDTTTNELRLHDGSTAGGHIIPNKAECQGLLGGGTAGTLLTNSGTPGTVNSTSIDATPTDSSTNPVASGGVYTGLAGKANKDLDNLTDTGKNITNWSSNVSNCVLNSPQDIKIEIGTGDDAGKVIVKAGTKVYVPNGSGVFDELTLPSDLKTVGYNDLQGMIFVRKDGGAVAFTGFSQIYSGTSGVLSGGNVWYDTTNNKIYRCSNGSSWDQEMSFPLAVVSCSSGNIISIKDVFNGFGYIGSHLFALPGLSALIPNGRNADGTLKNINITVSSVKTYTRNLNQTCVPIWLKSNGDLFLSKGVAYNLAGNTNVTTINGVISSYAQIGTIDIATGGILSNINKKYAYQGVDYNDVDFVVESQRPNSSNNYTWYRQYKSGWVEQGGLDTIPSRTGSGGQTKAVTFPIKMSDSNYTAQISFQSGGVYFANCQITTSAKTQTGMNCDYYFNASGTTGNFLVAWEVKGFKG